MPISLSEFKNKRGKQETIEYDDGDSIVFRWHPDRLTDDVWNAIQRAVATEAASSNPFEIAQKMIVPLVTEWDITDGGKPYEITVENVANLGMFVCFDILKVINEGVSEKMTKKDSSGG